MNRALQNCSYHVCKKKPTGVAKASNCRQTVLLAVLLAAFLPAYSQVWLGLNAGAGYASFRDMGVSPVSYYGLGAGMGYKVNIELARWSLQPWQTASFGLYEDAVEPMLNFSTYGIGSHMGFTALHTVWNTDHWLLMAGGTLSNYFGFKLNPNMFNASYGISDFASLALAGKICFDLGRHDGDQRNYRLRFYDQLSIAPVSLALRPGFSYVDNFTGTNDQVAAILSSYELSAVPFAEWHNELGASFVMGNGNRLGLAYRWSYLTTHNSGAWRYDEATHYLVATIDVNLGKRPEK